ncbi:MAG: hypothetical protein JRN15_21015 [Nitrososphaerota archaeon]|nr:hypothetical protein [Nitrososphaerota archaeon]
MDSNDGGDVHSLERDGSLDLEGRRLGPLEIYQFSYYIAPTHPQDQIEFRPMVYYSDQGGKLWTTETSPQKLSMPESANDLLTLRLQFKNKRTKELFDYLVEAFRTDLKVQKLREDGCGWRTMSQAASNIGLSSSTAYGKVKGGMGGVFIELKKHGLIETSSFPGERGRGGIITKVRIAHRENTVRRLLDS